MVGSVVFLFIYLWGDVCAFDFQQVGFLFFGNSKRVDIWLMLDNPH
jgi:hypothetical protein